MSTWRGHGGKCIVTNTNIELGISKWSADETSVLANKTNSKSLGHKQRQKTVDDTSWTIELPWDDTQDPNAIGLASGSTIKLVLEKGESGKKMTSNSAIIEKVGYVNDEDEDIVRLVISGYSNEKFTHS